MLRLTTRNVFLFSAFLFANLAQAQVPVIKLSCDVVIKKQSNGALSKMNQKTILLDVTQNEKTLFILSTDDDIRSVSSETAAHIIEVTNYSNDTRWHLVNKSNEELPTVTKMLIDRNSGQLLYTQDFSSSFAKLFTEITGTCSKVDMQKKKF